MITDEEKDIILRIARKYKPEALYLFGSSLEGDGYNDIDLGVRGINSKIFFKFYGELYWDLQKPVDLVEIEGASLFIKLVESKGLKIYG